MIPNYLTNTSFNYLGFVKNDSLTSNIQNANFFLLNPGIDQSFLAHRHYSSNVMFFSDSDSN